MLGVQFCFGLSYSCFYLLPKFLSRELHASAAAIGAVAATSLVAGIAATPWIGALLDRRARRPILVYSALVHAVTAAAFASVGRIAWPLYALRAINGVSYALLFNATLTLAADLAPPKKLGQALGLCGAAGMIANAIAPAIGETLAEHRGWPIVFWLSGFAALLAMLLSLTLREPLRSSEPPCIAPRLAGPARLARSADLAGPVPIAPSIESLASAVTLSLDPRRVGAFLCAAANGAGLGVMFTFTQPFALSLGATQVSSFFIGYTASALMVRLFLGSLADTWGRRRIALTALVLYGLVVFTTSLLRPELLILAGACLGIAHGLLYPALNALAVQDVPTQRRGAVMSYFFASFNAGFALWVLAAGVLAKKYGYPSIFVATGALLWVSLLALPKTRVPSAEPSRRSVP